MIATTCDDIVYEPDCMASSRMSNCKPLVRTAEPNCSLSIPRSVLLVSTALASFFFHVPVPERLSPREELSSSEYVDFQALEGDFGLTPSAPKNARMSALETELISYSSLSHGWDGYDGQPANSRATLDALAYLKALPADLPCPKAMLAGSGVVGLYWDYGDRYASIDFEGDGSYTYLIDTPNGYSGDEGVGVETMASELKEFLSSLPVA